MKRFLQFASLSQAGAGLLFLGFYRPLWIAAISFLGGWNCWSLANRWERNQELGEQIRATEADLKRLEDLVAKRGEPDPFGE